MIYNKHNPPKDPLYRSEYFMSELEAIRPKLTSTKQGFVLFSCFMEENVTDMVVALCKPEFFTGFHRTVFEAILSTYQAGVKSDIVQVTKQVNKATGERHDLEIVQMLSISDGYWYAHQLEEITRTLILQKIK